MICFFVIFSLIFLIIKLILLSLKHFKQLLCENDHIMIISWSNRTNFFYNNLIISLNIISIQILINEWFLDSIDYCTNNIIIFNEIQVIISITLCFWSSDLQSSLNELVLSKQVWYIYYKRRDQEMKFFLWIKNSFFSYIIINKSSKNIMKWVEFFEIRCIRLFKLWKIN